LNKIRKLNTIITINVYTELIKLFCRETGLDCNFIIEGETEDQVLAAGAQHAMKAHGLKAEEIFLKTIPCNFLCHTFDKLNSNKNM
jgi:predicted small metal-binding protein